MKAHHNIPWRKISTTFPEVIFSRKEKKTKQSEERKKKTNTFHLNAM